MAAEAAALGVREEPEVGELDRSVVGLVELVVAGPPAVDRRDPRLDLLGPGLPVGVGAAEVVGPLVGGADVLVEPAVRRAVRRVDGVDAQLAVDPGRGGRADRGRVGELEVGADDVVGHRGHRCTRRDPWWLGPAYPLATTRACAPGPLPSMPLSATAPEKAAPARDAGAATPAPTGTSAARRRGRTPAAARGRSAAHAAACSRGARAQRRAA